MSETAHGAEKAELKSFAKPDREGARREERTVFGGLAVRIQCHGSRVPQATATQKRRDGTGSARKRRTHSASLMLVRSQWRPAV